MSIKRLLTNFQEQLNTQTTDWTHPRVTADELRQRIAARQAANGANPQQGQRLELIEGDEQQRHRHRGADRSAARVRAPAPQQTQPPVTINVPKSQISFAGQTCYVNVQAVQWVVPAPFAALLRQSLLPAPGQGQALAAQANAPAAAGNAQQQALVNVQNPPADISLLPEYDDVKVVDPNQIQQLETAVQQSAANSEFWNFWRTWGNFGVVFLVGLEQLIQQEVNAHFNDSQTAPTTFNITDWIVTGGLALLVVFFNQVYAAQAQTSNNDGVAAGLASQRRLGMRSGS